MQRVIIDLHTQEVAEWVEPVTARIRPHYVAVADRGLVGFIRNDASASIEAIIKAQAVSYREVKRVPFCGRPSHGIRQIRGLATAGFSPVALTAKSSAGVPATWNPRGGGRPSAVQGAWQVAISHRGDLIAGYFADVPPARGDTRTQYVLVFDGADGSPVAKLALGTIDSLALSPAGGLSAPGPATGLR
jgi:hypothetical protein